MLAMFAGTTVWPPVTTGPFWLMAALYALVSILFDDETPRGVPGLGAHPSRLNSLCGYDGQDGAPPFGGAPSWPLSQAYRGKRSGEPLPVRAAARPSAELAFAARQASASDDLVERVLDDSDGAGGEQLRETARAPCAR